jgi:phage protein D
VIRLPWNNAASLQIFTASSFPADHVKAVYTDMGEGRHDQAKLVCSGLSPQAASALDGMPIMLEWGSQADPLNPLRFVGYVTTAGSTYLDSARSIVAPGGSGQMIDTTLVCLGATTNMQGGSKDVWQRRTIPSVVGEIADQFRFSYDTDDHDYVWPRLAQGGKSTWQFLNLLADQIGFSVIGSGTHIRFVDPARALSRTSYLPVMSPSEFSDGPWSGTLRLASFTPQVGSYTSSGHAGAKIVSGLHSTGQAFSYSTGANTLTTGMGSSSVLSPTALTPVVAANDFGMAQALAEGIERKMLWTHTATAVCTGGANVGAGEVVYVKGFNSDYDGVWYVRSAQYMIEAGRYMATFDLGRNTLGGQVLSTQPSNFSQRTVPAPTLINNRWAASVRRISNG